MSDTAGALSFTVSATDRASAPLRRIERAARGVTGGLNGLADRAMTVRGLNWLGASASGVARSMAAIMPSLGVLTAAGTAAGVAALADRWASLSSTLGTNAYRLQTTAQGLHTLQGAARLAGVSAEDADAGLRGLGDALSDAVGGRDTQAVQFFNMLRINIRDAAGQAKRASDVLPEVADGIARIADPRLQEAVMSALRLPASLLPFLKEGSAGLRRWEAEARRFGVISDQGAEAGSRFAQSQRRLGLATDGLANAIGERLAPAFVPVIDRTTEWIAANRELIAQDIGEWVDTAIPRVERMATGLDTLVKKTVGWNEALTAVGGLWIFRKLFGVAGAAGWAGVELGRARDYLRERAFGAARERMERDPPPDPLGDMIRRQLSPGSRITSREPAPGRSASDPRGIRNNNPLNLTYVPGQRGLDQSAPSDGRFGRYATMEDGVAQSVRQMQIHAGRGFDTLGKLIQKWAPQSENDTGSYIRRVERETGLSRDTRLDFGNEEMLRRIVRSMAAHENGRPIPDDVVERGVQRAVRPEAPAVREPPRPAMPAAPGADPTRAWPSGPPAVPGQQSQRMPEIKIQLSGLPAGMSATTTTRSPDGGVRVERALQGFG